MDTAIAPSFAAAPVPPRARRRRAAVLLGSVLLVTFLAYAGALRFGFVYDDAAQIVSNPVLRSWSNLPRLFAQHVWSSQLGALPNYYRPVFMAWCLAQFKLFGSNPLPWHLALLILHLIATALVFQLARRIFADDFIATVAAAIFGLHPIHLESVAWISGATDPLMAIFCLGSFLCYLRYRDSAMPHFGWLLLSLLQYGLACLSKEPAIVLPAIIALYEYLSWNERRVLTKIVHAVIRTAPLLLVSAAYLVQRWVVLRAIGHATVPLPVTTLPLSWPALLWFYARKLVWPARLALFYDVQPVLAPTWQSFWMPLLLVLGIAIAFFVAIERLPTDRENRTMSLCGVAWFSLAWMVVFLLPVLDIVSLEPGAIAHDRYLYLPSVGFALLLALGISRLRPGHAKLFGAPAAQVAVVTVVACAMAFGTVKQSVYWANDLLLYYRAVDVSPTSLTAANRLADALLQRDYTSEGIRLHEQILRSNPSFWQSHFQLGNAYFRVGRFSEAEEHLLAASRLQPSTPQIYIYLAIAQIRNQHYDAAEQSARAAVALWPTTPGGFYVLGTALAQQEHWPEAVAAYERELANDPDQPKVRAELEAARRHVR